MQYSTFYRLNVNNAVSRFVHLFNKVKVGYFQITVSIFSLQKFRLNSYENIIEYLAVGLTHQQCLKKGKMFLTFYHYFITITVFVHILQ